MVEEDVILYKCIICGKAWKNKQALRGHMNAHRKEDYHRTSIIVERKEWETFKGLCRDHNTTTCHAVSALIKMWNVGVEKGVVTFAAPNPVIFQLNQNFLGKPRSKFKIPFQVGVLGKIPKCDGLYRAYGAQGVFACSKWDKSITISICEKCPYLRGFAEVR